MEVTVQQTITYGDPPLTAADLDDSSPSSTHIWHLSPSERTALDQASSTIPISPSSNGNKIHLPAAHDLFTAVLSTTPQIRAERNPNHILLIVERLLAKLIRAKLTHMAEVDGIVHPSCAFGKKDATHLAHQVVHMCREVFLPEELQMLLVSALRKKCHEVFAPRLEAIVERERELVREKREIIRLYKRDKEIVRE